MLLLNFEHQPAATPYRSSHAIFVEDGAEEAHPGGRRGARGARAGRTLSVRAFDQAGQMLDGVVVKGREAAPVFERLLAIPGTAYLHVHNAGRGCYAARVERV